MLFPFGFGLSYTRFGYSDFSLVQTDAGAEVSLTLTNEGETAGAEVVQIYVEPCHAPVERPGRELKAFEKVFLKAGEKKRVSFSLRPSDFAFYSVVYHRFAVSGGVYKIAAGASSRDIRLLGKLRLEGDF